MGSRDSTPPTFVDSMLSIRQIDSGVHSNVVDIAAYVRGFDKHVQVFEGCRWWRCPLGTVVMVVVSFPPRRVMAMKLNALWSPSWWSRGGNGGAGRGGVGDW